MNGNIEQKLFEEMKLIAKFMGETGANIKVLSEDIKSNIKTTQEIEREVIEIKSARKSYQKDMNELMKRVTILDSPRNGIVTKVIDNTTANTSVIKILRIFMVVMLAAILGTGGTLVAKVFGLF